MLILSLTYIASLERADAVMAAHVDWVNAGYDQGWFLASGRKVPRTGGLILAKGDRAAIEAYLAQDPFVTEAVARYEVMEIELSRTAEGLDGLTG